MKILHVIPHTATDQKYRYLGSTKDIRGRTEYFRVRGFMCDELVTQRNDCVLLAKMRDRVMYSYDACIFEFPVYPKTIAYLKKVYPNMCLIVRSHNAEFLHKLHYAWTQLTVMKNVRAAFSAFCMSFVMLCNEYQCGRWADYIITIAAWEAEVYWRILTRKEKAITVPYFLPACYENDLPADMPAKKNKIALLMSVTSGTWPLLLDAFHWFARLATTVPAAVKKKWHFVVTGVLPQHLRNHEDLTYVGFLKSPLPLLCESRALSLISNYGFGFKTKILDALRCNCYVLVTKKLYDRLPEEVIPYCIVVNPRKSQSLQSALDKMERPFPKSSPNEKLKSRAFKALDTILHYKGE